MPAYIVKIRKREDLNNIPGVQKPPTTVYKIRLNNTDNNYKNNNIKINNNLNNNNNPNIIKCNNKSVNPLSGSNNHNMVVSNNKLVVGNSNNGSINNKSLVDLVKTSKGCIVKSGGYVVKSSSVNVNNNSNVVTSSNSGAMYDTDLEDSLRPLGYTLEKRTVNLKDLTTNKMCTVIGRNGHNKVR
ncbi:unnamed protein product, partial [Meganyctiphanes norvegica]